MSYQESESIELKESVTDALKKEIIAFANTNGGHIYIGIQDDGTIVGIDDSDAVSLQVSNMVRDAIKPDITMFMHYHTINENGKVILCIDVQQGTHRPYYLAKKGLRPEGVYVRQGSSSVPATDDAIRAMIKATDGDHFEAMRSLNQVLTFDACTAEFAKRHIPFGPEQMQTLKLVDREGIYSNLGLLLSDQCTHSVKVAVFQGTTPDIFRDRHEFTGSLLSQLNDIYDFIDRRNQTQATFDGLLRIDTRDYPETALREALLNLLVHRDYAIRASSSISIYDDRIEFLSVGGLAPNIEQEDLMVGLSVCRNQNLANVFYRLQLIEAYGTGIRKIMDAYKTCATRPQIIPTKNAFKIILPNMNTQQAPVTEAPSADIAPDILETRVLSYLATHDTITRAQTEALLDVSPSTASRILKSLMASQLIVQFGKGRATAYRRK